MSKSGSWCTTFSDNIRSNGLLHSIVWLHGKHMTGLSFLQLSLNTAMGFFVLLLVEVILISR